MMTEASDKYAHGLALMGENRFAEAETCFADLLDDGPADDAVLRLYDLSLLYQGKYRALADHVVGHGDSEQASRVLHDLMMRSILADQRDFVRGLYEAAGNDDDFAGSIACFWMGCLAHLENRMNDIDSLFERACQQAIACTDTQLDNDFRESALAGGNISLREFSDLDRNGAASAGDMIDVAHPKNAEANKHAFVFFMSADGIYFDAYAEAAITAIAAAGDGHACHLHLIGPDDAVLGRARDLAERVSDVALTITSEPEPEPSVNRHTYFACNRFVLAKTVMERHDKDLLIIDVDDFVKNNLGDLTTTARDHDVCFFHNTHPSPLVACSAGIVYVADNPRGRLFLDNVSAYITKRLSEDGRWMLDQAALYCALKTLADGENGVRFGDFSALLSAGLRDYLTPTDNFKAKVTRDTGRFG